MDINDSEDNSSDRYTSSYHAFSPKLLMVLSMQDLDRFCEVELMYIISFLFIVY